MGCCIRYNQGLQQLEARGFCLDERQRCRLCWVLTSAFYSVTFQTQAVWLMVTTLSTPIHTINLCSYRSSLLDSWDLMTLLLWGAVTHFPLSLPPSLPVYQFFIDWSIETVRLDPRQWGKDPVITWVRMKTNGLLISVCSHLSSPSLLSLSKSKVCFV